MGERALKAYTVSDDEHGHVVFAVSNASARRAGASELGADWEGVTCVRAPQFDGYAPGPVPQRALYEFGWWFECGHCGHRVERDEPHEDRMDADGHPMDPAGFGFFERGRRVFCSLACMAQEDAQARAEAAHKAAVIDAVAARWPMAQSIDPCRIYARGDTVPAAYFHLPGLLGTVRWQLGEAEVFVEQRDVDAFRRLYP